jgi:hypothetical protein
MAIFAGFLSTLPMLVNHEGLAARHEEHEGEPRFVIFVAGRAATFVVGATDSL